MAQNHPLCHLLPGFFWGVKSNLAEKIRVNKRVCAVCPGIPGACIRRHLLAVFAPSVFTPVYSTPLQAKCGQGREMGDDSNLMSQLSQKGRVSLAWNQHTLDLRKEAFTLAGKSTMMVNDSPLEKQKGDTTSTSTTSIIIIIMTQKEHPLLIQTFLAMAIAPSTALQRPNLKTTLPETNIAPEKNGWKTIVSFWISFLAGAMLVSADWKINMKEYIMWTKPSRTCQKPKLNDKPQPLKPQPLKGSNNQRTS